MYPSPPPVELLTSRLRLWLTGPEDAREMLRFHDDNRAHLEPWAPPAPTGFYTLEFWQRRMARVRHEYDEDRAARFAIVWRDEPGRIIGTCNLSEIIRGGFHACFLGYSLDQREQGKGAMTEAVAEVVRFGFETMELHRIMANYIPTNERSGKVLKRLGFVVEGYARDYLYIDGAWRDHIMSALTNPAGGPPRLPRS